MKRYTFSKNRFSDKSKETTEAEAERKTVYIILWTVLEFKEKRGRPW